MDNDHTEKVLLELINDSELLDTFLELGIEKGLDYAAKWLKTKLGLNFLPFVSKGLMAWTIVEAILNDIDARDFKDAYTRSGSWDKVKLVFYYMYIPSVGGMIVKDYEPWTSNYVPNNPSSIEPLVIGYFEYDFYDL